MGSPQNSWRYHLDFVHTGGGIIKSQVKIRSEQVFSYEEKQYVLNREPDSPDEDEETLKYTHLEQVNANRKFRELQVFFQNIEYLNVVPQLVRESASVAHTFKKEDYYGRNFLERLAKMNERTRNSYFNKINEFLKIAVPQLKELKFIKDEMGIPHLEARYIHWRAKGSKQQEAQFSDGTLRLIGLLFAIIDSSSIVILEEPEINLHSGIIVQLPEFIAKIQRSKKGARQVIITTHSYEILSSPGIAPDEVIVLQNTPEGTTVKKVSEIDEIRAIVESGLTIADAVIPFTRPKNIEDTLQLNFDF